MLVTCNEKPYAGSQMAQSHMTLNDLERSRSRLLAYEVVGGLTLLAYLLVRVI